MSLRAEYITDTLATQIHLLIVPQWHIWFFIFIFFVSNYLPQLDSHHSEAHEIWLSIHSRPIKSSDSSFQWWQDLGLNKFSPPLSPSLHRDTFCGNSLMQILYYVLLQMASREQEVVPVKHHKDAFYWPLIVYFWVNSWVSLAYTVGLMFSPPLTQASHTVVIEHAQNTAFDCGALHK